MGAPPRPPLTCVGEELTPKSPTPPPRETEGGAAATLHGPARSAGGGAQLGASPRVNKPCRRAANRLMLRRAGVTPPRARVIRHDEGILSSVTICSELSPYFRAPIPYIRLAEYGTYLSPRRSIMSPRGTRINTH